MTGKERRVECRVAVLEPARVHAAMRQAFRHRVRVRMADDGSGRSLGVTAAVSPH